MKKYTYVLKAFWWWIIKKKLVLDKKTVPKGCKNWYVNLITSDYGICKPEIVKQKTWYGKTVRERKMIKKRRGYYYYLALNDRNGKRKALNILNIFHANVRQSKN